MPQGERPKVDMTPIIQLITTSIAPGTWNVQDGYGQDASSAYGLGGGFGGDAGGIDQQRQPGAIVPFFLSISLIIKHTAEVHDQVADLLRQLRRLHGPSGVDRSPVHHGQRHVLRVHRRRLRLPDPVRHGRQTQHLRDSKPGGVALLAIVDELVDIDIDER